MVFLDQPRFSEDDDFLLLREERGENPGGIGAWWIDFQAADTVEREQLLEQLLREPRPRRRPSRPKSQASHF